MTDGYNSWLRHAGYSYTSLQRSLSSSLVGEVDVDLTASPVLETMLGDESKQAQARRDCMSLAQWCD